MPAESPTKPANKEVWPDWMPAGYFEPPEDELITRDELVTRAQELRPDITLRSIRLWESLGLLPRPVRRWHRGAVRAVYAPWVTGLAASAYDFRRGRWPLDEARSRIRDTVEREILQYNWEAWGERGIPMEFMRELQALAERQTQLTGRRIPKAEIRFLDENDEIVGTLRQPLDTSPSRLVSDGFSSDKKAVH